LDKTTDFELAERFACLEAFLDSAFQVSTCSSSGDAVLVCISSDLIPRSRPMEPDKTKAEVAFIYRVLNLNYNSLYYNHHHSLKNV
jgi:hypothetical protein